MLEKYAWSSCSLPDSANLDWTQKMLSSHSLCVSTRSLKVDANSPILFSMCDTLSLTSCTSDVNCCARERISACIVLQTSMSLKVVSMTGWLVVGKARMDSCNYCVSSSENSEELTSSALFLVGDIFCLDLAGLEVLEDN